MKLKMKEKRVAAAAMLGANRRLALILLDNRRRPNPPAGFLFYSQFIAAGTACTARKTISF